MPASPQDPPAPTDTARIVDTELHRWRRIYHGETYYYGEEPGPVARRAVRYHRAFMPHGGAALDAGCGEGQDLAFLAERGYTPTGIEFTEEGAEKARRLLAARGLRGEVLQADLRTLDPSQQYDLVLAVNSVQFMGLDALPCLERLMEMVAPGGVLGLSLFAREAGQPEVGGTVYYITLAELLERFGDWQCLESAQLWQWNVQNNHPQPFVTLVAQKTPRARELTRVSTSPFPGRGKSNDG